MPKPTPKPRPKPKPKPMPKPRPKPKPMPMPKPKPKPISGIAHFYSHGCPSLFTPRTGCPMHASSCMLLFYTLLYPGPHQQVIRYTTRGQSPLNSFILNSPFSPCKSARKAHANARKTHACTYNAQFAGCGFTVGTLPNGFYGMGGSLSTFF